MDFLNIFLGYIAFELMCHLTMTEDYLEDYDYDDFPIFDVDTVPLNYNRPLTLEEWEAVPF